jgi:2-iminoacetate synthase
MSFFDEALLKFRGLPMTRSMSISGRDVERAIASDAQSPERLLALLSPAAAEYLEPMARKAHALTVRHFGKTIQLYTPMYLSNHCENQCVYCGFNVRNGLGRRKLTLEEVRTECEFIASTGIEHILVLTGDSKAQSPVSYIKECLGVMKNYFSSISIEIYALTQDEYAELIGAGADTLTIYQETYDEPTYAKVHLSGPKKDYRFRLDAPERAAKAGIRGVNIGVLLGLNDWRTEVFLLGLHSQYLQDRFPDLEVGASIPRLRPHAGGFRAPSPVDDRDIVQIITALRLFQPRLGLTLSTRESSKLREDLLPLGITRMSAGSTTKVGGHTLEVLEDPNEPQFEISDPRNVGEIKAMLAAKGYQPVLKDWMQL